jgi:endogenous inhibitor of DNA gyrase (YacG/DUF329 family)
MAPLQGSERPAPRLRSARCALELCGRTFTYDPSALPASFPFCSRRCKEADLGMWVTEEYRVPASPATDEELSELDLGGEQDQPAEDDDEGGEP